MAKVADNTSATPPPTASETSPDRGSLLAIIYAPTIWAIHFLVIYGMSAVTCARSPDLFHSRMPWIGAATVACALAIVLVSMPPLREWRQEKDVETDHDSVEGRSHFLAHAALLLSALSLAAVAMQTIPFITNGGCR